jgi:hypothetical protein
MTRVSYAATRVGVSLDIDFGTAPVSDVDADWEESFLAYTVDPYVVAYGLPYSAKDLVGFSIGTTGGLQTATTVVGRPDPGAVDTGAATRFLAEDATAIAASFTWPARYGNFKLLVRGPAGPPGPGDGTHAYDGDYQMYVDGALATYSAVVVDGSQSTYTLACSQILPDESQTLLAAFVPHTHAVNAVYALFEGYLWALGYRLGKYEATWGSEVRAQTGQVVIGGPTIVGLSFDATTGTGVLLAAGADGVEHAVFDATGFDTVAGNIDLDTRFGGGNPIDWFEIDHWDTALSLDELERAAAVLEAVYGVTT